MFTGLIREMGTAVRLAPRGREASLTVACTLVLEGAKPGDSIAVDGACLTVEHLSSRDFTAFLSAETLEKTTLGALKPGDPVNLEPSLTLSDRLGGHLVQGHAEGIGTVLSLIPVGTGWTLAVELPADLEDAVIPKGSIALAGVSLTVASTAGRRVEVAAIPETLRSTTMASWKPGTRLNVETDLVGRYVLSYLKRRGGNPGALTMEQLLEKGF
jgi:riboflavin synthase